MDQAGLRGLSRDSEGVILGDIITSIDGEKLADLDALYRFLDKKQIGETVQVEVFRNGKTLTVPVKLTPLPQQSRAPQRF